MATSAVDVRRWTREEYNQLASAGVLRPDERLELIDGVIYEMTPQNSRHAVSITALQEALRGAFPQGHHIRVQLPLALGLDSEPEPDLAVVRGSWRDYRDGHPTTATLVAEVSDSSSAHDRKRKQSLYARAGIPEYWILDVAAGRLEVYREPAEASYRSRGVLQTGDAVTPLSAPAASIAVADLLP
jgi:Uma2 family endonuclease